MGLHPGMREFAALHAKPVAAPAQPERGHARGQTADRTDRCLRGVPVIGHGSGAIRGSSPGGDMRLINVERVELTPDERTTLVVKWRLRAARRSIRYTFRDTAAPTEQGQPLE